MAPKSKPTKYTPPTPTEDLNNTVATVVTDAYNRSPIGQMVNNARVVANNPEAQLVAKGIYDAVVNGPVPGLVGNSPVGGLISGFQTFTSDSNTPNVPVSKTPFTTPFTSSYNPALDLNHGKKLNVDETAALLAYSYFSMNMGFFSNDREVRGSLSDKNLNDLMYSINVGGNDTNGAAERALDLLPPDMAKRWRAVASLIPENLRYDNKGTGKRVGPLLTLDIRGVMAQAITDYKSINP